jgi:hypothetical protein
MKQNNNNTICLFDGRLDAVCCLVLCCQPLMQHSKQGGLIFMSNTEMALKNNVREQRKKIAASLHASAAVTLS